MTDDTELEKNEHDPDAEEGVVEAGLPAGDDPGDADPDEDDGPEATEG